MGWVDNNIFPHLSFLLFRHYKQSYQYILEQRLTDVNNLEVKLVAGFLNYKVCFDSFQSYAIITHSCMHACKNALKHACTHTYMHACTYTWAHAHMSTCTHAHTHLHTHCEYVLMHFSSFFKFAYITWIQNPHVWGIFLFTAILVLL